jgi:adenosine/AMP kinase
MKFDAVTLDIPAECNIILGHSHFIKTVEDLYEILAVSIGQARFGIAFSEASGPCLIRTEGNDNDLIAVCVKNLQSIASGHAFCIILKGAFPVSVLNQIKNCQETCTVFCATANPVELIIAETEQGRGIMGVIDGFPPRGVEKADDKSQRKEFLRKIGYKL